MQIQTEQTEQTEQETAQAQWPPLAQQTMEATTAETHNTPTANVDTIKAQAVVMKLKRQARIRWHLSLVYAAALISTLISMLSNLNGFLNTTCWSIVILVSGLFYAAWLEMRQANKVLVNINDVKLVGPLAEALDAERFVKPKPVVAALRRLLPRLQASDAALLTREQRACLYRAINQQSMRTYTLLYDKGLAVDVLKALQQIGDKEALPHVKRAAKWSRDKNIRHAANDCLPFLLEKEETFKRSEQYLRPSSVSAVQTGQADALLRPASANTAPTAPEQLLRASESQE